MKSEHRLRNSWEAVKLINKCIMGVAGDERERKEQKEYLKKQWLENLPYLKDINLHIKETQQIPSRIKTKGIHIKTSIVKLLNVRDRES